MTAALSSDASADYARQLTDRIKVAVEGTWHLITEAYQSRAWAALGYTSWDDYTTREFGTSRLRLPREERTEVVGSLRDAGLSLRAIAAATGLGRGTVERELSGVPSGTPDAPVRHSLEEVAAEFGVDLDEPEPLTDDHLADTIEAELRASDPNYRETAQAVTPTPEPAKVTGTDGKTYSVPTPAPRQERRQDLPSSARTLTTDVRRVVNRLIKLREDDRLPRNAVQVASLMRSDLSDAIEVCQDLLDAFPTN